MAEAAQAALTFLQGRTRAELDSDAMLRFALVHVVQVIGEAATRVSAAGPAQVADIDWTAIVGGRNRRVHAYFDIDTAILWATVTGSLLALLQQLRAAGAKPEPDDKG
ncbi:MAG: DUF86 domain-containing protein [Comamonadaceae bacterium]|nr:DUF86 domain-containing protein [Comamonadaceae bacterium]